jgi:predicted nucleic acid-binding protein
MQLVIDANVLVAELIRARGRWVLNHPALTFYMAQSAWDEAQHEVVKRLATLARRGTLTEPGLTEIVSSTQAAIQSRVNVLPEPLYHAWEEAARARIPRDPTDWPTVAVALATGADIWTEDNDFFGCGVATWTTAILVAYLRSLDLPAPA